MTDNKELYIKYLKSQDCPQEGRDLDKYWVVELIRRGKDNPNLAASNYHFKNYYFCSINEFEVRYNEIKILCDAFNMRAYFSVNYKRCSQVLLNTVAESARRAAQHDYKKPWSIYESCSGSYADATDKKWVIDIDEAKITDPIVNKLINIINTDCSVYKPEEKVIMTVPTRSGVHLITTSFPLDLFAQSITTSEDIDIQTELPELYMSTKFKEGELNYSNILHWVTNSFVHKNHVSLLYENIKV